MSLVVSKGAGRSVISYDFLGRVLEILEEWYVPYRRAKNGGNAVRLYKSKVKLTIKKNGAAKLGN